MLVASTVVVLLCSCILLQPTVLNPSVILMLCVAPLYGWVFFVFVNGALAPPFCSLTNVAVKKESSSPLRPLVGYI
jgi:hypothetical protein